MPAPRPPRRWLLLTALLVLGFLGCAALVIEPRPPTVAYCAECGLAQRTQAYALRGTAHPFLHRRHQEPTPVSALLAAKGQTPAHVHRWLEPQRVPDPMNEFGPPVMLSLGFINTPRVVGFLRDLCDYGDPTSVRNWKENVLRPETSYVLDDALRFYKLPPGGFGDRARFLAWWQESAFPLYQHIREETEAD